VERIVRNRRDCEEIVRKLGENKGRRGRVMKEIVRRG